jgi:mannose/fructose/N-acetylgalactosamine-specific phosphotransferase system component IIB
VPVALLRVDERLIHGQVTVGWGMRLSPARYVVVDDRLSQPGWERDIIALGTPAEAEALFVDIEEGRGRLPEWMQGDDVTIVLTRDLEHMLRLLAGSGHSGIEVNLGGLHHRPGRREVLPYLFLDEQDLGMIRELLREGADVFARDLPSSRRHGVDELLERGAGPA